MSYSDISGLELFQMPFGSNHVSRQQQAYSHQDTAKRQQAAAQSKALQQQSGRQTAVQQPKVQKPVVQSAKPETVHKPDITPPKHTTDETGHDIPEAGAKAPIPVQTDKIQTDVPAEQPSSAKPEEQDKSPQKELVLDMSSGSGGDTGGRLDTADDTEKRKAHEEAEAKRKAEWEAKQLEKKQKEAEVLQKLQSMSDDEAVAASTRRISTDVERITRRNMKECVAEHIQDVCRKDPAFARLTMHPRKSMAHCFQYINRKAKEFILQQEMKDNDVKAENGIYGCDVPDGMVYQWAEDYFHAADAPEDAEKEEKFVPRPYVNTQAKAASRAKKQAKEKKKEEKQAVSGDYEQMSFV